MKHNIIYQLLLIALLVLGTWSCERDDICADATPTTPHLIIRFYDVTAPEEFKQVRQLTVRGFDENGNELLDIITRANTDSIVLPLRFEGENISTLSRFILEKDADFTEDEDDTTVSNIDIINVNYVPEFQYVSRACGYKSIFNDLSVTVEPDTDNWILSSQIINTTVDNETSAQVILRH